MLSSLCKFNCRNFMFLRFYCSVNLNNPLKEKSNELSRHIFQRIKATGPMTVAEFMKFILTSPLGGYYMYRDVFGKEGDFVTSPELGQLFGEMVGIWFLNEWSKFGSPKNLQIVELGPGRGTLCQDMLRVFKQFRALDSTSVHLVEVSPLLSELQAKNICVTSKYEENDIVYRNGISLDGVPVSWYRKYVDVPDGFTILIAHEFFDALPINKIQNTEDGYREVLIDIDPNNDSKLRYIIAREETPAVKLFIDHEENRDHFEISPESIALMNLIANKIVSYGGIALIVDYGHNGESKDSFRAFRKHQLCNPLEDPGSADLTADVDFLALKKVATKNEGILAYGPVNQKDFLLKMGIEYRLNKLRETCTESQKEGLQFGFNMMIDDDKMGARFKLLSLFPSTVERILNKFPPVGFS